MTGKRWLLVLAILVLAVLGAGGVGLLVVLPKWVEGQVLSAAEAQGVTIKPGDIAFGWGWVQLTQVKLNLDKVRSVEVQVGRIDVTLDGMAPQSIELTNVDSVITGSITNIAFEIAGWTKAHPGAYALPLTAKNVHARFVEPAGTPAWLEVSNGQLSRTRAGGVFAAEHARLLGVDLGKVGAGFAHEGSAIALGFGESDLGKAPFRIEVSPSASPPTAKFTMTPMPAERLAKPLGMPLPISGVIVSSTTNLAFGTGAAEGSASGSTTVTLKGYVPPHPFELDGFIFGDTTTFDTKFAVPAIRDRITLTDTQLKAGKFELHGDGLLMRGSDHSEATLTLKGELPCSALAAVETESRLAKILSHDLNVKAGQLAEKLVNGTVTVGLKASLDTRNLAGARMDRTIGVGCGLHPLSLAELSKLLPADVNAFLQSLPALPGQLSNLPNLPRISASGAIALPSGMPAIPSGIPALPSNLPKLPTITLPDFTQPAPAPTPTSAKPAATSAGKASAKPA
ncbi:MAG: hypothetical protein ABJB12_16840, partial [Pseudomonadota bacterium]